MSRRRKEPILGYAPKNYEKKFRQYRVKQILNRAA